MSTITAPAASHPKRSPYCSSCQREDEKSQFLRVDIFFADGSRDFEEAIIGPCGNWIPSEDISELEERLQRTLRRRNREKFGDSP
jgi:hypothetical protein